MRVKLAAIIAVIVVFAPGFWSADAEVLTYKSAVVWRQDELGDYVLPQNLSDKKIYEAADVIYTEGDVRSITVNWKAQGPVLLEVSANNGLNYTQVINGVPLTAGFLSGRAIKWKAHLAQDCELLEVSIIYSDSFGVIAAFGTVELSGFKYRKPITILSGSQNETLFNFQIKLKLGQSAAADADVHCDGNVSTDFKDIRFTAADGLTLLPYYIESISGAVPNRTADVFVKVGQIPAPGVNIYIYYGSAKAVNLSSAEAVFDFYDSFSGGSIDENKWDIKIDPQGKAYVYESGLFLEDAQVRSKDFVFKGGIIEYAAKAVVGSEIALIVCAQDSNLEEDAVQAAYSSAFNDAQHCIATRDIVRANDIKPIVKNEEYAYRVIGDSDMITFQRYSAGFNDKQAEVSFKDTKSPDKGAIGLKVKNYKGAKNLTAYKWVRVRKYAEDMPRVSDKSKFAAQETANLAEFNNSEVRENGNLVLSGEGIIGDYVSPHIRSPFSIRIITPYYKIKPGKTETARFDVSTDGAKTFLKDCVSGAYYYVSKGDIPVNNKLVYRIVFNNSKETKQRLEVEAVILEYSPGYLSVISPNGAETLTAGSKAEITWSAMEYDSQYPVKLEYSLDMGKSYRAISAGVDNSGSFLWDVPKVDSLTALVKVSDALDLSVFDISDKVFSISRGLSLTRAINGKDEPIVFTQEYIKYDAEKKGVLFSDSPLDLSGFIDSESVMRSDVRAYDILVKGSQKGEVIDYDYGEIVRVKPSGYEWSSLEKRRFLIIKVYLTPQEADQLTVDREVQTEIIDGGKEVKKRGVKKFNLEKLGVVGEEIEAVYQALNGKALVTDLIEEIVE